MTTKWVTGDYLRSDFVNTDMVAHLLWALTPSNRLACEVCLATGWRIDDVLKLKSAAVSEALEKKRPSLTITEAKTGKKSRRYLSRELLLQLRKEAGDIYVFEGRDDYRKHRTRQAVFLDIKKAAKRFNIKINLSTHSLRKNYAVYLRKQGKSLDEIQAILNHDNLAVTMLYALSDELTAKYKKGRN